jgi:shikimate kinase
VKDSLILIGMPGSGKSTAGVLLAKTLCLGFVDTDLVIQDRERRTLQQIINEEGLDGFVARERNAVLSLAPHRQVIATGGSVVLSPDAMDHLRRYGPLIYLDVPIEVLERRIRNIRMRGIVLEAGQTLRDVARIREPLYLQYADFVIHENRLSLEQVVSKAASWYKQTGRN